MIKEVVSSRNEDFTFYIQCSCGNELIQFYYYAETKINAEICGLRYFGYLSKNCIDKFNGFNFTKNTLFKFIDTLKSIDFSKQIELQINDGNGILAVSTESTNFVKFIRATNQKDILKKKYCWDIYINKIELARIIELLDLFVSTQHIKREE